jgi:phosphoserine phosphatase RsbU/P
MSKTADLNSIQEFIVYQKIIVHQWSRMLTVLGFTLVPLFFILDYFTLPAELLPQFAVYRSTSTLIVLLQYLILRKTKPTALSYIHGFLFTFIVGGVIVLMTADLGGFDARYYAGLNLVIIAATLLLPIRAVYSAFNGFMLIAIYVIWNIIVGKPYLMSNLISNLFFLSSTVIISVSINHVRFRLIEKEFYSRSKLQDARDSLWTEMELAKRIQTSLLPEKTRIGNYEVAGIMIPAEEVGGDYYDIVETQAGEYWVAIGDVSGHGLESGLIMMMAQICFFSMVNITPRHKPSTIIEYLNYILRNNLKRLGSNRYMTIMVMRLDESRVMVSGNHQDIIIHRAKTGTVEKIPLKGSWVGLKDDIGKYLKDQSITVNVDDLILLFTDGVTEAGGKYGEMFGQERLEKLLNQYANLPSAAIVQKIAKEVILFHEEQDDDITLMVLRKLV